MKNCSIKSRNDSFLSYSINKLLQKFLLLILLSFSTSYLFAQKTITGTVAVGDTMLSASTVQVKGTNISTITDENGKFSIRATPGSILVISHVGYSTQEAKVNKRSVINVQLESDIQQLSDVVVVGYGTQKKTNLTAAVDVVDMKNLENRPVVSAAEMLKGSVSNLNITTTSSAPGANPTINIRGFTGINSQGAPLIIVDGVPQDIEFVNPNDIASISVLKDASASAIYGSRAPNGVIIITTKKGKKNSKMQFNYSGTVRLSTPLNMPKNLNAYDFALLVNESGYNTLAAPEYPQETIQRIKDLMDGKITDNNIIVNGKWGGPFDANANEDHIAQAYRNKVMNQSHYFSMSGGGEKTTYYAGVGYIGNQGIYRSPIDHSEQKYITIKINSDINKWLNVGINTRYNREETIRPNIRTGGADDGSLLQEMVNRPNIPNINYAVVDGVEYSGYNELSILPSLNGDGGQVNSLGNNLLTTISGELKPINGLSIRGSYTWNIDNNDIATTALKYRALQPDGTYVNSRRSVNTETYTKAKINNEYSNFDLTATYHKILGNHDFTALIGFQQELNNQDGLNVSNTDFYSSTVPSFGTMYGTNFLLNDQLYSWATRGYFGRLSYNYEGRYLFDFNGRYDASSRYSSATRWAFFPSFSAGYNIAREKFWPLKDQISMFKLTASWGSLGNVGTGRPLYLAPLNTGGQIGTILGGTRPPYVALPQIVSPGLTWTKPRTIGFGLEIAALQNRINFEYRWYQRTTFDEQGPAEQLPEVLGTAPPLENNAVSETRGWEVSLEWKDKAFNIRHEALRYGVKFLLSDYIGYVVKYASNISGTRSGWTPGQQFGVIYGFKSAGILETANDLENRVMTGGGFFYQGDISWKDLDGDGRIFDGQYWYNQSESVNNLGYNYPRYTYSITLNAGWKNWSLFVLLNGVGKQAAFINDRFTTGLRHGTLGILDFQGKLDYWTMENPNAFFPRRYNNSKNFGVANDQYILNLAHLRIQNINLNYTIPLKNKIIEDLQVNLSVENAGMIFTKSWAPLDPQLLLNPTYPPSRIYSIGAKFTL